MSVKRKSLADLYKRGIEVTVSDGDDKVIVWVQKLNPVDHETVLRKANAARARLLMYRNDPESEYYQAAWASMQDMNLSDPDNIIQYVASKNLEAKRAAVESELSAEEEWSKDDYLQGLTDSWSDGLKERWIIDNDDEEAAHVLAELKRFDDAVEAILSEWKADQVAEVERVDEEDLVKQATVQWLEKRADDVWYEEYQLSALWKAVRYPDKHAEYYFTSRDEVDNLEDPVRQQLLAAWSSLMVEPLEGKGSGGTPASSKSSEQQEAVGTEPSSGPQVAVL